MSTIYVLYLRVWLAVLLAVVMGTTLLLCTSETHKYAETCCCCCCCCPHASPQQAADILEAPKLELSPEERVTIPLLNSEDSWVKQG
jgi:hypothetical protein